MTSLYNIYALYGAELVWGTLGVALVLLLWVFALQWRLARMRRSYQAAMRGAEGADLEGWLAEQRTEQAEFKERLRTLETYNRQLNETVKHHAGRVGVVRFNPFSNTGSNQSFAVAWLDAQENGVVISSLYTRDGVRLYAKPLTQGASTYTLSDEEVEAIAVARKGE